MRSFYSTVLTGCISNNKERLEAILFKNSYSQKSVELSKLFDYFQEGFFFLNNNKNFHNFIEILLTQGNMNNFITFPKESKSYEESENSFTSVRVVSGKGKLIPPPPPPPPRVISKYHSFGDKLISISKLYDMKTKDNKISQFRYIIEYIMKNLDSKVLNFMPMLEVFTKMNLDTLTEEYESLKEKFKNVEILKKWLEEEKDFDEDDKTEEFLDAFYNEAKPTIQFLGQRYNGISTLYENLSEDFGLKKIDIKTFISLMKELYLKTIEVIKLYKDKEK